MKRDIKRTRARESHPTIQCIGCGDLFLGSRSDQRYCSDPCRQRNKNAYNNRIWPSPVAREIPLTKAMIHFREALYAVAHHGCVGYRLYSKRLDWWFPLEGKTLRSTGHFSDLPYYHLVRPFEQPLVPIDDTYELFFCERHGNVVRGVPSQMVTLQCSVPLNKVHPQLKERITLYLREQGFREAGPAPPPSKTRGLLNR